MSDGERDVLVSVFLAIGLIAAAILAGTIANHGDTCPTGAPMPKPVAALTLTVALAFTGCGTAPPAPAIPDTTAADLEYQQAETAATDALAFALAAAEQHAADGDLDQHAEAIELAETIAARFTADSIEYHRQGFQDATAARDIHQANGDEFQAEAATADMGYHLVSLDRLDATP